MKVGILALQGDVREHAGVLQSLGATPVEVRTQDQLAAIDALILPGGESTTIGKLLARFGLLERVRDRARDGMPLYGTCAGLILMSNEVVGRHDAPHRLDLMDTCVRRNAYGRQVDSFEADIRVRGLQEAVPVAFIRAPAIERTGAAIEVLATWEDSPVLVRQDNLLGSTFHPEVTGDGRIHEIFLEMMG